MNTPLVNPIPETDPSITELVKFYNETLGFCPNSVRTMQIRPHLAEAFINLNKAVMENHGRVTSALKRLIAYISSYTTGCQYCQAHGIRAAERYGASEDQLLHIWDYKTHTSFSEAERAALDFSVAASSVPNAVDDTIAENLRQYWDDGEIVEITGVIALFGFLNRWNDSMGTTIEQGAIASGLQHLSTHGWTGGKHLRNKS
ncbi:MAG: carboxymuconolactone decarboxylase family protein [Saprospiraceae bacterium]|uniref:Carboxymuconolactone decarboxylase family protein n=1 Tax=Candidatus Opimibacter skivensis TaxID=2982028 RepID=A0A9D7SRH2_9BACT|nr:carboxymuconolactone decarboxylase family protein [Candidatus Opimibacter skivensis]